jgi:hypothetical protein
VRRDTVHIDLDRQGGYPLRGTPLSCRTFVVQAPAFVYCDSVKNNRMYNVPCVREKPSECDGPRARPRAEDASTRQTRNCRAASNQKCFVKQTKPMAHFTSLHYDYGSATTQCMRTRGARCRRAHVTPTERHRHRRSPKHAWCDACRECCITHFFAAAASSRRTITSMGESGVTNLLAGIGDGDGDARCEDPLMGEAGRDPFPGLPGEMK